MLRSFEMAEDASKLDYHDPEWVAEQLGIDKNTVYKYLQDGTLPGLQLGRKWLVSERRLAEFLERAEREQTERRRATVSGKPRPFALPQRARMLDREAPREG
jgi:excisionase family DNA binding protein